MLELPPHSLEVDGFELGVSSSPDNIAGGPGGHGDQLLQDGFLRIDVCNLGTNPAWPTPTQLTVVIAKLADADLRPEVHTDVHVCLLYPDDRVTGIGLREEIIDGTYGVWLSIDIVLETDTIADSSFSHLLMIEQPRLSA